MSHSFTPKTYPSLVAVVHQAVRHAPNGLEAQEVLKIMGYDNYHTGMAELTQEGRKFDADRLLPAMHATGSDAPMHFLARQMGGEFIKLPEPAACNASLVQALAASVREFGEYAAETAQSIADGDLPKVQVERITKEGQDAIEAICGMIKLARVTHEAQYGGKK